MKKKIVALLMSTMLAVTMLPGMAFAEEGTEPTESQGWTAGDFEYGDVTFTMNCRNGDKLEESVHVVTKLSDAGREKLKTITDIVIPSEDTEGNKVNGVANSAFAGSSRELGPITSVQFPENVTTEWDKQFNASVAKEGLEQRGDFFIGNSAFAYNKIKKLTLPEGVIMVGSSAFKNNKLTTVAFPASLIQIQSTSFAGDVSNSSNQITKLVFPEISDFGMEIDKMAFAYNRISTAILPSNIDTMFETAFMYNNYVSKTEFTVTNLYKKGETTPRLAYIGHNATMETAGKNNKYQTLKLINTDEEYAEAQSVVDTIYKQAEVLEKKAEELEKQAETLEKENEELSKELQDQADQIKDQAEQIKDQAEQIKNQEDAAKEQEEKLKQQQEEMAKAEAQLKLLQKKVAYSQKRVTIKVKAGKKKVTANWTKLDNAAGYELSVHKKLNSAKIVKRGNVTKYTKKKLKSKNKYYVKVRAYTYIDGQKVYSAWSKVKTVKVK